VKFGANTFIWTSPLRTESLQQIVPKARQMGFDLVELALEDPALIDVALARRLLDDHGLGATACAALGPQRDLSSDDEGIRQNGLAYIRACIDACQALGARLLVGPIYSAVGKARLLSREERAAERGRAVKSLRELAPYAGDRGVTLAIEPLNRFETDMINLAEQAISLVDEVGHPNVQIMLDTFHMNIEERSLARAIVSAGHRLVHVHTCENDRGAPGSGHVPWGEVVGALKEIGYDGALVIESFTPGVKEIARAAAIWRPLAPSEDDLARDGLAFLKRTFV